MWLLLQSPVTSFKLKFKWNLITTKWCSYTCINNLSARDHSAGSMDIRDSFAAWKSMLSLFGKIHLFICVNCVWMDHKSEILLLKDIETVPTGKKSMPPPPTPKEKKTTPKNHNQTQPTKANPTRPQNQTKNPTTNKKTLKPHSPVFLR